MLLATWLRILCSGELKAFDPVISAAAAAASALICPPCTRMLEGTTESAVSTSFHQMAVRAERDHQRKLAASKEQQRLETQKDPMYNPGQISEPPASHCETKVALTIAKVCCKELVNKSMYNDCLK